MKKLLKQRVYMLMPGYEDAIEQASNEVLKQRVSRIANAVTHLNFFFQKIKHQHFASFEYQAKSWHKSQQCYSKIESTGKGLNIRCFIRNMDEADAHSIYFDFYVKRGDASENWIKEVQNMCFSDRLSNHGFWANFMRLILCSLAYEMFLLLKVGATIKKTKRRIYYRFSKAFLHHNLLRQLILQ